MDIKIVCEDARYMPKYANNTDACMDMKLRIEDKDGARKSILLPNQTKVYGSGIKVSVPEDHVMLVFPRSSVGIKLNCMLTNTIGVIDSGYRDEVRLAITNFGKEIIELTDGQRIAQFMIIPRPKLNLIPVADDEDFKNGDRGGGIGSTGI